MSIPMPNQLSDNEIAAALFEQLEIVGLFNPDHSLEHNIRELANKAMKKESQYKNACAKLGQVSEK